MPSVKRYDPFSFQRWCSKAEKEVRSWRGALSRNCWGLSLNFWTYSFSAVLLFSFTHFSSTFSVLYPFSDPRGSFTLLDHNLSYSMPSHVCSAVDCVKFASAIVVLNTTLGLEDHVPTAAPFDSVWKTGLEISFCVCYMSIYRHSKHVLCSDGERGEKTGLVPLQLLLNCSSRHMSAVSLVVVLGLGELRWLRRNREALSRGSDCGAVWFWPSAYEDTFNG
jgi:hypothetical protein